MQVSRFEVPNEILANIFSYLPVCSLFNCEKVCKVWQAVATSEAFWKSAMDVCNKHLEKLPDAAKVLAKELPSKKKFLELFFLEVMHAASGTPDYIDILNSRRSNLKSTLLADYIDFMCGKLTIISHLIQEQAKNAIQSP